MPVHRLQGSSQRKTMYHEVVDTSDVLRQDSLAAVHNLTNVEYLVSIKYMDTTLCSVCSVSQFYQPGKQVRFVKDSKLNP